MSQTPKIPITGELWLNADGFPQLTVYTPEGAKIWLQVPTRDALGHAKSSKSYHTAMRALGVEVEGDEEPA